MRLLIIALALLPSLALAEQPSLADMQAARNQFMGLFATCDSNTLVLQAQLAKAQAEIAELKAKLEPKKED